MEFLKLLFEKNPSLLNYKRNKIVLISSVHVICFLDEIRVLECRCKISHAGDVALGPDWNISATTGCILMKFRHSLSTEDKYFSLHTTMRLTFGPFREMSGQIDGLKLNLSEAFMSLWGDSQHCCVNVTAASMARQTLSCLSAVNWCNRTAIYQQ